MVRNSRVWAFNKNFPFSGTKKLIDVFLFLAEMSMVIALQQRCKFLSRLFSSLRSRIRLRFCKQRLRVNRSTNWHRTTQCWFTNLPHWVTEIKVSILVNCSSRWKLFDKGMTSIGFTRNIRLRIGCLSVIEERIHSDEEITIWHSEHGSQASSVQERFYLGNGREDYRRRDTTFDWNQLLIDRDGCRREREENLCCSPSGTFIQVKTSTL